MMKLIFLAVFFKSIFGKRLVIRMRERELFGVKLEGMIVWRDGTLNKMSLGYTCCWIPFVLDLRVWTEKSYQLLKVDNFTSEND